MEKINKTVSFRLDEETLEKINYIKEHVLKNKEASHSELLRRAINFMYENKEQALFEKGDVIDFVKYYVRTAVLKSYVRMPLQELYGQGKGYLYNLSESDKYELLDELLYEINRAYDEHYLEEVVEIGMLYDDENPITLAKLVRFKNRELPELFLSLMNVEKLLFENLDDDELAEFILEQFNDPEFKARAKEKFFME